MKTLYLSAAAAAMVAVASPAFANKSWTGVHVGVGIGAGAVVHDLNLGLDGTNIGFDGIGGEGILGTVSVGADYQLPNGFVVGAFFDYDFADLETTLDVSSDGGRINGKVSLEDMWSIGGRLGYLTSPTTLVYGLLAYTEGKLRDPTLTTTFSDLKCDECSRSHSRSSTANLNAPTFKGYSVGGGIETMIGHNFTLKGEYRYTEFDAESLYDDGFEKASLEPSVHTGRLSLNYRFGVDRAPAPAPMK